MEELETVCNPTDPRRYTYPNERKYTWFSAKARKQMARLDFFLVSSDLIPMVTNSGMYTGYRTDHSLVYLYINIRIPQRGKRLWMFSTSLLHDQAYVNIVKQEIKATVQSYLADKYTVNGQTLFEVVFPLIFNFTISYSAYKVKEERENKSELEFKINKLTDHLVYCRHTGASEIIIDSLERDLNFFQKELQKSGINRSLL